jgi:nitroreductase
MGLGHSFINNLEWRRAERHFGGGEVDTTDIEKAIINAPSSFGIQPYKVYAIKNKELKEKLKAASYGQPQVSECHTLFIFCTRTDIDERAEQYIKDANAEGMRDMLIGSLKGMPNKTEWAMRQTYIALGFGLAACAENRIASCPMEGFSTAEVTKVLALPETLVPTAYLAVGEQSTEEGPRERFRFPESDLLVRIE